MFVERKGEESAEASDPKTACPGTRNRPVTDVDAETNPGRGARKQRRRWRQQVQEVQSARDL